MATPIISESDVFKPRLVSDQLPPPSNFGSGPQTFALEPLEPITVEGNRDPNNAFKVRLVSVLQMMQGAPGEIKQVAFDVTPTLSETQAVEYSSVQPIHMPGSIQVYKFTSARTFEITAHFISRNTNDALKNIQDLQILRSWTKPFFGLSTTDISKLPSADDFNPTTQDQQSAVQMRNIQNSTTSNKGVNLLGAPPEVLYLYGYSAQANDKRENILGINLNRIPVVITNLTITYPEDVDYIPIELRVSGRTEPFPVKMDVGITLAETHSPAEYERFDLASYKAGKLKNF